MQIILEDVMTFLQLNSIYDLIGFGVLVVAIIGLIAFFKKVI